MVSLFKLDGIGKAALTLAPIYPAACFAMHYVHPSRSQMALIDILTCWPIGASLFALVVLALAEGRYRQFPSSIWVPYLVGVGNFFLNTVMLKESIFNSVLFAFATAYGLCYFAGWAKWDWAGPSLRTVTKQKTR
jgi:hypothetical protein